MNVFLVDEQDEPLDGAALRRFAELVLEQEGFPPTTELAVHLVAVDHMAEYNGRFMDRQGPTDVLAFPLEDLSPGVVPRLAPDDPPIVLGDVFLCPAEIRRRSATERVPFDDYLFFDLAHGILHLLGYGHEDDRSADAMARREDELLDAIGKAMS